MRYHNLCKTKNFGVSLVAYRVTNVLFIDMFHTHCLLVIVLERVKLKAWENVGARSLSFLQRECLLIGKDGHPGGSSDL